MQKIISSIIKHLNIYKKEISQAGITIASINLLWFIRRFIPHALFSSIMERKHVLVERRIKGTIGGGKTFALCLPYNNDRRSRNHQSGFAGCKAKSIFRQ